MVQGRIHHSAPVERISETYKTASLPLPIVFHKDLPYIALIFFFLPSRLAPDPV
jgi:hypothetical protein